MKPLRTAVFLALCASIVLAAFCTSSSGITGNYTLDATPYVGIVVLFSDPARTQAISYGTCVLISPTVVLTAGHCVRGGVAASVCFDQGPIYCALDETGSMYYETNQPIYNGVPVPYPTFAASMEAGVKASQLLQTNDVGLIILDTPVQEVTTFPTLPTAGLAETVKVNTPLKVMGYGIQCRIRLGGQLFGALDITVSRNSANVQLLSTDFFGSSNYIKCTANAAQGKGGVAFGDSGGPVLYNVNGQNIVLAINALVSNVNCAGVTYHTRIDNPDVLSWISGYL
jgi:hypothetical protein